jgi:hypothetical protein
MHQSLGDLKKMIEEKIKVHGEESPCFSIILTKENVSLTIQDEAGHYRQIFYSDDEIGEIFEALDEESDVYEEVDAELSQVMENAGFSKTNQAYPSVDYKKK